jgi:murein DD-endopeptidase MepM/ murein hydrolase activator NlpD
MYETKVNAEGEVVCGGATSYAALTTQGRRLTLYHYEDSAGAFDYFDEQGRSLKKNLMVTPVDGARISSGYGQRRHPILGYSKMHKGLDFAVSSGTPIKAAGDGVVEFSAYNGSYGNLVRLQHANSYKTQYAHMSRFARGIRTGVRVKQGQIIGYVGTTGRSTGPHLHYEVLHHGMNLNPASIKSTPGRILQGSELARFMEAKAKLDVQFASLKEPAVYAQVHQPDA